VALRRLLERNEKDESIKCQKIAASFGSHRSVILCRKLTKKINDLMTRTDDAGSSDIAD
jgi:hypothetical protein